MILTNGVTILLTGNEVALAIDQYIRSKGIIVNGPRTVKVNRQLCKEGMVYIDPEGAVEISRASHQEQLTE